LAGNYQKYKFNNRRLFYPKRGRKNRINYSTFFAVLIVLIILLLVGIYIYFNDVKMPVALSVL